MSNYFKAKPFVSVNPNGEKYVEAAKNHERVLQYYYQKCPVFYLEKCRLVKYTHMYGCGYQVPSWKKITRQTTIKVPRTIGVGSNSYVIGYDEFPIEEQLYDGVWFKTYSPSEVFIDGWSHRPKWVMIEEFVHYSELIALADQNQYDSKAVENVPLNCNGQDEAPWRIRQTSIGRPALETDPEMVRLQHLFLQDGLMNVAPFLTLANDAEMVRQSDNWFDHGEIPVIQGQAIIDPDNPYPMAMGVMMLPSQKMINMLDNVITDHTLSSVYWQWKYGTGVDPNQLLSLPNHRIGPLKQMDQVDIITPPEVKHDLLLVNAMFSEAADELAGYYSAQKGAAGQGPRQTATSDTIFQQEGNIRISSDIQNFEQLTQIPEARQTSKNVSQMMPDSVEIAVEDLGGPAFQRLTREEICGEFQFQVSGASEQINRAVAQQQMVDFFQLSSQANQLVMLPTGEIVPMPVQDNYQAIKMIYQGWGQRDTGRLLINGSVFGRPVNNDLLAQNPTQPPGYLATNPANGGLINPAMLPPGGGAPGGGGIPPNRSFNPGNQIQNTNRGAMVAAPTGSRGAF